MQTFQELITEIAVLVSLESHALRGPLGHVLIQFSVGKEPEPN